MALSNTDSADTARIAALFATPVPAKVLAAFRAAGQPVRLVGGAVRDALLNVMVKDIDLATPTTPEAVMALLQAADIKVIPTGLKHGTVTAVIDHQPVEITTLRRDVETDGRWAVVAFTDDWQEDAARRDFTINAMSADPDGTLHDYFGGRADLAARRVRFVGNPAQRLEEDVLRLLRYYRFEARYGGEAPDDDAVAACRAAVGRLSSLSAERVRAEILRILETTRAAAMWRRMDGDGVLESLALTPPDHAALERMTELEQELFLVVDPLLRLMAACPADPDRAAALSTRLRLSTAERERWTAAATLATLFLPPGGRDFLYRCGNSARHEDAVLLAAARQGWPASTVRTARTLAGDVVPVLPLAGRDLAALGLPRGPAIGRILREVEEWWRDAGFLPDRHACLEEARERIKTSAPGRSV